MDDQVLCLFILLVLKITHGETAASSADGVVQAPPSGRVEFEGSDLPMSDSMVSIVTVCRLSFHIDVSPDVVRGDLVHVAANPRNFYEVIPHAALPCTFQWDRQGRRASGPR